MQENNLHLNLKVERTLRGISLESLSKATRIPIWELKVFEENEHHNNPDNLKIKGYLNAYIENLGLDPDLTFLKYQHTLTFKKKKSDWDKVSYIKPLPILIAVILIASFLLFTKSTINHNNSQINDQPELIHTGHTNIDADEISDILKRYSEMNLSVQHRNENKAEIHNITVHNSIILKSISSTWIRWTDISEGKEILECLFPGDVRTWVSKKRITIEIGNPQAIELFDGDRHLKLTEKKHTLFCFHL